MSILWQVKLRHFCPSRMPSNRLRGAPGLLLLGFAVVMTAIAVWGWVAKAREYMKEEPAARTQAGPPHNEDKDECPTGLGGRRKVSGQLLRLRFTAADYFLNSGDVEGEGVVTGT